MSGPGMGDNLGNDLSTPDGARKQMIEVALRRIDAKEEVLKALYIDNESAPPEIREVFTKLVAGALTKDQARSQLNELADNRGVNAPIDLAVVIGSDFSAETDHHRMERILLREGVRMALIDHRIEKTMKSFEDPKVQILFKEMITGSVLKMLASVAESDPTPEEAEELKKQTDTLAEQILSDPAERMKLASELAENEFQSQRDFEVQFEAGLLRPLHENGNLSLEILGEFKALTAYPCSPISDGFSRVNQLLLTRESRCGAPISRAIQVKQF